MIPRKWECPKCWAGRWSKTCSLCGGKGYVVDVAIMDYVWEIWRRW